jgi:hypothetical protein
MARLVIFGVTAHLLFIQINCFPQYFYQTGILLGGDFAQPMTKLGPTMGVPAYDQIMSELALFY